jgi:transcriptional regulator with XRE-family HTH domain
VDRAPAPPTRRAAAPTRRSTFQPAVQATPEPLLRRLFGDALRRERTAQGRTLQDVATDARISIAYLSEIERGRKEASSEVLVAVCRALRLRLVDLLTESTATLATAELESELRRRRSPGTEIRTPDRPPGVVRSGARVIDLTAARSEATARRADGAGGVVDLGSTHERARDGGPVAQLHAVA